MGNGEKTWEPLSIIKQDDEITVAKYAIDNNLENTHGWKWAKKWKGRDTNKFICHAIINKAGELQRVSKCMFGIKIPRTIHEAYTFDKENKNNKWTEAIKTEVNQME